MYQQFAATNKPTMLELKIAGNLRSRSDRIVLPEGLCWKYLIERFIDE